MTYPAYGDPVYLTRLAGGALPSSMNFIGTGGSPTGLLKSDVFVGAAGAGLQGVKVNADGTLTASGTSTTIPDPGNTGSGLIGTPPNDVAGYFTIDTTNAGGGSYSVNVRKYVVDPVTLAITQQGIVNRSFTFPYSFTPQINPLANAIVSLDDYTATQTSHQFQIIPITSGGLGSYINVTLDSTGLTGFDGGAPRALTDTAYYTNRDRFWAVTPTGTLVTNIQAGSASMIDVDNNYNIQNYGCVPNLFTATGGTPEELIEVSDTGVVTGTHPISGLVIDSTNSFVGETWAFNAVWAVGGVVYLSMSNVDGNVGAITVDPLGQPRTYFMRNSDGSLVIPTGLTADGRVFAQGYTSDYSESRYSVYEALPAPLYNNANCGVKVIKYTVTANTGLPYTVTPLGPNNDTHHGQFQISDSRNVSFMASLSSDNAQDFYVQPVARYLTWSGISFTTVSSAQLGSPVHMTGDAAWTTITRLAAAPDGATHWGLDFVVQGNSAGTTVPTIGTVLYLDCVYVVENGMDLAGEPYLDGDQVGTARGAGYWEGTPHDSTSIWGAPTPIDPTNPPDSGGGGSGGTDPVTDPTTDTPPDTAPIPVSAQVAILDQAADLVARRYPGKTFCLDADIQLGDHLFNTIDDFGTLWVINEVEGWWNLPDPDIPDITRGIDDGSYETRGRYSARIFTVSGSFWPASPSDLRTSRDRLIRAANLCHYGAWFATHEADATRASQVWLSGRPSIATVKDNGRTDFSIGLKAPDPIKYGLFNGVLPGWNSAALKSSTSTADFGRVYDRVYAWAYPTVPSGGVLASSATISNDGNVRVSPIITVYGPTLGPLNINNITTGQTTRVRLGLAADDILLIDCQNRTVSLNGVPNKRLYLDTITDWIYLDPGANTFNYSEETGSTSSFITVQWRSGWIG